MQALPNAYFYQAIPLAGQAKAWPAMPLSAAQGGSPNIGAKPSFYASDVVLPHKPALKSPDNSQRLTAALKAAAYITPALLLARFAPSKATTELIPSDWKVWAKMGLSVACLGQLNKALNWEPPPWLGAMMNVLLISPLVSGKNGLRMLPILLPTVAGLVQGTHLLTDKAESTLQKQYGVPPLATRLLMSVLSMGVGFMAIPRLFGLFRNTWLYPRAEGGKAAMATAASTCSRGCCTSAVCMNEIAEYGSALGGWLQNAPPQQRKH